MKFSKFGRATLAAVFSLGVSAAFTACGPNGLTNTVDYVYVASSKNSPGQINVYDLDYQSGALTQISGSPFSSGGSDPVALVTSPNFKNLYVVNRNDNTVVEFAIGSNAAPSQQNKYTTPGSAPNAVAINSAGTLLFVTINFTSASSTPASSGGVVVYPIKTDGSLGSPVQNGSLPYYPLTSDSSELLNPAAVNAVTQNPVNSTGPQPSFLYVVGQNATTGLGSIVAFSVASGGALTQVSCSSSQSICSATGDGSFNAGTAPNATASTPRGLFLYVTDSINNQLISYTIQSSGQIIPSQNGPTRTDVYPDGITVDPRGEYVYVSNYNASDISAYTINPSTGYPTGVAAAGTYTTGTGPTCIFVEPALGNFVYTTNFLDSTVSGLTLNPNTGTLAAVQNTPFLTAGEPTCAAAVPHGNHAISTPVT